MPSTSSSRFSLRIKSFLLVGLPLLALTAVCDGLEATRMIRELERASPGRKPAYIVALTADAFPENKTRCLEAGMDEFLTKPLRMDLIRAAVERGINKVAR
jgi:two-component system, sensor histidine kinase